MKTLIIEGAQFNLIDQDIRNHLSNSYWDNYRIKSTDIQRQYIFCGIDSFSIVESVYDSQSIKQILKSIGGKGK